MPQAAPQRIAASVRAARVNEENPSENGFPPVSGLSRAFSAIPFIMAVFPVPAPPIARRHWTLIVSLLL
jgi:hypothetical protein